MSTVVMGVGNVCWADEGFGPRAIERLKASGKVSEDIEEMHFNTAISSMMILATEM